MSSYNRRPQASKGYEPKRYNGKVDTFDRRAGARTVKVRGGRQAIVRTAIRQEAGVR